MRYAALLLIPALAAGCAARTNDPTAGGCQPVSGKVTYDGRPAEGVVVTLMPTDAPMVPKIPHNPRAVTKADGTFVIGTHTDTDGAYEGGYQVLLTWPGEKNESAEGEGEQDTDKLKGWYDGTHSTLVYRVKSGGNAIPPYELPKVTRPPPASSGVPGRN